MDYSFGPYRLDTVSRVVWLNTDVVRLPPKAIELLICLVERNGGIVTKEEILERVWPDTHIEESGVARIVSLLRRTLKSGFGDLVLIETIPRRGYRFSVPVVATPVAAPVLTPVPPPIVHPDGPSAVQPLPAPPPGPPALPTQTPGTQTPGTQTPASQGNDTPSRIRRIPRSPQWLAGGAIAVIATLIVTSSAWSDRFWPAPAISTQALADSTAEEDYPSISADGSRVVYSAKPKGSARFNLFVKLLGTAPSSQITKGDADDLSPVWSPDHAMVAFSRLYPDRREIRVTAVVGTGPERLILTTPPENFDLAWSPDGKWLAYNIYNTPAAPTGGIFLVSVENSTQRRLTSPGATFSDMMPAFSPDGLSVAFVRYTPILDAHDVFVIPTSGGTAQAITHEGSDIRGLAFTADGRELVYASDLHGASRLYRVPVSNPGQPRAIDAVGFSDQRPSISRQGGRMVYTERYDNTNIWRIPGPGRTPAPARLLLSSNRASHSQQYSPDGSRIVFISDRSGAPEVWVANADGSQPIQLTPFNGPSVGSPAWSPDGKYIAFDFRRRGDGKIDIFVVPSHGGKAVQFTTDLEFHHSPIWSRDGKGIYSSHSRSGQREVWLYPWPAGAARQVTFNRAYRHRESPDGRYIYYTKVDSPSMFRTPLAGGPEEVLSEMSDRAVSSFWTVTPRGYYWFAKSSEPFAPLLFLDVATRKTTTLASSGAPLPSSALGISVSPDDEWVTYPRVDRNVRRIMVAENFR